MQIYYYDVVILGCGAAGLSLALELTHNAKIAVISKNDIRDTASYKAQGGIAAVISANDHFQSHISDTINAGGMLCDLKAVQFFIEQGQHAIEWLVEQGVLFERTNALGQPYDLHREGGHSKRRVLHIRDETGKYIVRTLFDNIQKNKHIDCFEKHIAFELLTREGTCIGCLVFNQRRQKVNAFIAKTVVLATGGCSGVYHKASHEMAIGDGIGMAYRAGCRIENMEFFQFHPTCFSTKAGIFLISETLRGEGGLLTLPTTGERFMLKYDKRAELAPRDIVARAMTIEMQKHHLKFINLDISHRSLEFIKTTFPKIYSICLQNGVDITRGPIPVSPAAHYACGGVATDLVGQTDLRNLFAIGEVACTGLHGANRLASNSLLECIVSALSGANKIKEMLPNLKWTKRDLSFPDDTDEKKCHLPVKEKEWINRIRKIMWFDVGIIRSNHSLLMAKAELISIKNSIEHFFLRAVLNQASIELRNLAEVACLIVQSALCRKESRGAHYNINYENNILKPKNTYLQLKKEEKIKR